MAGRKRKAGKRYPSGKLRPPEQQTGDENPQAVALEARMRLFGVSKERAVKQETGTPVGRLINARGPHGITIDQHEALVEASIANHRYLIAIRALKQRSASDFSGASGYDGRDGDDPEYVERCQRDKRRWLEMRRWILEASPLAMSAFEAWVLEEIEAWSLTGDLRLCANALVRLRKLDKAA